MNSKLSEHSEKLAYFAEVAHAGSIHAASRKLRISAPSLSQAIKELELAAGGELFKRSSKGVVLTDSGEKLLIFSQKFLRDISELELQLSEKKNIPQEKVRIGTFQSIALKFWPIVYESLQGDKSLTASITTNRSRTILDQLMSGQIDLALTVETLKNPQIISRKLYADHFSFVLSEIESANKFTPESLRQKNLYYFPSAENFEGLNLRQFVRQNKLQFAEECELDSFELIEKFVCLGYGVGILPTRLINKQFNKIKKIQITGVDKKFGEHFFYISYRKDSLLKQVTINKVLVAADLAVKKFTSEDSD